MLRSADIREHRIRADDGNILKETYFGGNGDLMQVCEYE